MNVCTDEETSRINVHVINRTEGLMRKSKGKKTKTDSTKHEKRNLNSPSSGVHFWYLLPHSFELFLLKKYFLKDDGFILIAKKHFQ